MEMNLRRFLVVLNFIQVFYKKMQTRVYYVKSSYVYMEHKMQWKVYETNGK